MQYLFEFFEEDKKIKKHEKLLIDSVIEFMQDKLKFKANRITVKKKFSNTLIGDVVLSDASINKGKFTLHFNPNQSYRMIIGALIHELTHIKQISKGELSASEDWKSVLWKDGTKLSVKDYKKVQKNYDNYKNLAWEKEAYDNQNNLKNEYISSKYFKNLKGKNDTLDFIIDNI
tara:strand:- start:553 stop:1074 length:522 start_codon:yes stop_codon:yes gene_type:complete